MYERTEGGDGPISQQGGSLSYTAKRQGVEAGVIESTGSAFFFNGKEWVHVWISD
jgi:hypothetical protein